MKQVELLVSHIEKFHKEGQSFLSRTCHMKYSLHTKYIMPTFYTFSNCLYKFYGILCKYFLQFLTVYT